MRRTRLFALIIVFGLVVAACGSSDTEDTVVEDTVVEDTNPLNGSAVVIVDGESYTVIYELEVEVELDWNGYENTDRTYKLMDEATKNSGFYVWVFFYNGHLGVVSLQNFTEINEESFLQKIILENSRKDGKRIILDIIEQIEKGRTE